MSFYLLNANPLSLFFTNLPKFIRKFKIIFLFSSGGCYFELWITEKCEISWIFFISFSGRGFKQSNVSFLFSLKNNDNLPPFKACVYQNNEKAIYSHPSCGPTFGGGYYDLHISNNSHANQESCTYFGHTYQPPAGYIFNTKQTQSLLAGSRYFTPNEIETFHWITPLTTGSTQTVNTVSMY